MILNSPIILISCWGQLLQANDSTNDGLCEHARAVERQAAGRLRVEACSGPGEGRGVRRARVTAMLWDAAAHTRGDTARAERLTESLVGQGLREATPGNRMRDPDRRRLPCRGGFRRMIVVEDVDTRASSLPLELIVG